MKARSDKSVDKAALDRRSFLSVALGTCAIPPLAPLSLQLATSLADSLTKEQRDSMTPSQVIDELKKGNESFRAGKMALEIIWQRSDRVRQDNTRRLPRLQFRQHFIGNCSRGNKFSIESGDFVVLGGNLAAIPFNRGNDVFTEDACGTFQ
jgi:hypothetical protein